MSPSPKPGEAGRAALEFLPDADELERRPLHRGVPIVLYLLLGVFCSLLLWASLSEIDLVVTARGRLTTPQANMVIQPMETAQIETMPVRMGQIVSKGQVLATLNPTFAFADLNQLRERMSSLDAQLHRLEAEQDGKEFKPGSGMDDVLQSRLALERKASYQARAAALDENIGRLKAGIVTNTRDIESLGAWVKSLREMETMNEEMYAKRYQSRQVLLESQERRLAVERNLEVARNRDAELKRELAAAESDRSAFGKEWRQKVLEEIVAVRRDRDSLAEQLQKAELRNRLVNLTAPEDAVVLEIAKLSPGSIVREAEALFTLVPLNVPLEAEVQIDTADIGHVKLGDRVRVKIDAFPFQKHGTLPGRLAKLSQDSFLHEGLPAQSAGSYYLGRVDLENLAFRNIKGPARLLPGMTLSAEIVVGKRTVASYFLYPVVKAFDEAAREP